MWEHGECWKCVCVLIAGVWVVCGVGGECVGGLYQGLEGWGVFMSV